MNTLLENSSLDKLFHPDSIAVIGASNHSKTVGMTVFSNLKLSYKGKLYAVNPKHKIIQNTHSYSSIKDILEPVDLAVIATPSNVVPQIISDCGEKGVKNVIILSAGFAEIGLEGVRLEQEILKRAKEHGIRIVGPNCLGVILPHQNINASFSKITVHPGELALVSQSGALCAAILDWASPQKIGFSAVLSLGNIADVEFGEVLEYLTKDPQTKGILLYIEGIKNASLFMEGLKAAASQKPVVVIKAGRFQQGSIAAATHTGAMIGQDDVFEAVLNRFGAVRVYNLEELFDAAKILSKNYILKGNNLCIITNGGGAGVIAADKASEYHIPFAKLSEDSMAELNLLLPKFWSHHNPVDIMGDATPARYKETIIQCLKDPNVDGILTILVPVVMSQPTQVAKEVIEIAKSTKKPILTCWMGQEHVKNAKKLFLEHQISSFDNPEDAIIAFSYLEKYYKNQLLLKQAPEVLPKLEKYDTQKARSIIQQALRENRTVLTSIESKAILTIFGIPTTPIKKASNLEEALKATEGLGYNPPLVMKILSPDITHKQDVGGVKLNLTNPTDIQNAFKEMIQKAKTFKPDANIQGVTLEPEYKHPDDRELMVGIFKDKVFGPVISFGMGGTYVEAIGDRAVVLPPLNLYLIKQLISKTRAAKILGVFRNQPPVNMNAIQSVLLSISNLILELPEIQGMDINPLIANSREVMALDVRFVVA